MLHKGWENFKAGKWQSGIDVRGFIQAHYQPFSDQPVFLSEPTRRTRDLTDKFDRLREIERAQGGVLDIDTSTVSSLLSYEPGYLDRQQEIIVGLQTGRPLKRSVNPFGGIRMAEKACKDYGFSLSDRVHEYFRYRTTHNDGVFRVYTPEMRAARKSGIITGLPDAYGRGRLIGDYRRVALYGTDFLIEAKEQDKLQVSRREMNDESVRLLEEVYRQIDFLKKLRSMASQYGFDISNPACTASEAIQWLYFAYLASIKEQNGAAMSLGRVSTFLDIYIERDIAAGRLSESKAQELIDDFVLKLRMARQLRTSEYNELFAGDPLWITEAIGGMGDDGRTLVSKTSYRMLHTLDTLGAAPEPNLTILWSDSLPEAFKTYCADIAIRTSAVQFENDDLMRPVYGDDYAIACCVSAGRVGYDMQFFGARCNLPKVLLMALNGGRDEISGEQIGPVQSPVSQGKLDYNDIKKRFDVYQTWLCRLYVRTMNVIHAMHDKYAYEKTQMALHETDVNRFMAFGLAGLSVTADAFSAVKYAEVYPVFDKRGLVTDFGIKGHFPCYGNDDDRADQIARSLCENFYQELSKTPCYRNASHTLSILTITSNVVYGLKTGATPDGRKKGEPFAPGANPMHGRDKQGVLASLNSVAKIPYEACRDGISNTLTLAPSALGRQKTEQLKTLKALLGGYFQQSGHHLNINVLNRSQLEDAMDHPEKYPNLTIRISGYAVQFTRLSREQQQEILKRTWHS